MSSKPFHLGWFTNYMPPVWNGAWRGNEALSWTDGSFYVDMAKALERACFDYIMLEDSEMIPDAFGGSMKYALKHAHQAPKLDPILLLARMAAATEHVGLIATASTSFWPPFLLARQMATVDHMTHGRAGWNIVTSSEDRAAQNFGMDKLYDHDERYERADEYTDLVHQLWASWEPDAVVADPETGVYVDADKVHTVDFKGTYYSSRGPLNTPPMPQGKPVICQAGSSSRGREFAAKYAETILAVPTGLEKMRDFRDDVRSRMEKYGRKLDEVKILFICEPILGSTREEAQERRDRLFEPTPENVEKGLLGMSTVTDIDFSTFDVDAPLPTGLSTNGHQSSLANFYTYGETLKDVALTWLHHYADDTLVGTPDQVAERMGEMMDFIGGDGFLISGEMSRQYISQICDGLVPALQRRGLARTSYTHATLRDNLLEF